MGVCWRRTVILLVFIIAVLQIIHMSLLNHLETIKLKNSKQAKLHQQFTSSSSLSSRKQYYMYKLDDINNDRVHMHSIVKESSILDSSGEYRIINNLMKASSLNSRNYIRNDLAIITQTNLFNLNYLPSLMKRWQGLLSITIFTSYEDINLTIELILLLRYCSPYIRYNASFHLVYPLRSYSIKQLEQQKQENQLNNEKSAADFILKLTEKLFNLNSDLSSFNCDHDLNKIFSLLKNEYGYKLNYANKVTNDRVGNDNNKNNNDDYNEDNGVEYPNNLLRNVARRNSLTKYILVIDIDLIPSGQLREQFMEFVQRNKINSDEKIAFVLPTYEIDVNDNNDNELVFNNNLNNNDNNNNEIQIPEEKTSLLNLITKDKIRPFYFELCWKCQKYTDYDAWQKEPITTKLNVLFEVLWKDPWEPFYISHNQIPFYDERFRQYGFNRISQVCETYLAGYKFSVLNNAFLIHRGYKRSNSFHKDKDIELERNRQLFRQFKNELKDRYPDTTRRCY